MKKKFIRAGIGVAVCLFIGFLSFAATEPHMEGWFVSLEKPAYHPSKNSLAWAWGAMYVLMGIAAGRVWAKGFYHKWVKVALYHFMFQLILAAFWPILFFGLQNPLLGLLDLLAVFILLVITIKWFKIVSLRTGYMLYPYLLWIIFAAFLNFEILRLN